MYSFKKYTLFFNFTRTIMFSPFLPQVKKISLLVYQLSGSYRKHVVSLLGSSIQIGHSHTGRANNTQL